MLFLNNITDMSHGKISSLLVIKNDGSTGLAVHSGVTGRTHSAVVGSTPASGRFAAAVVPPTWSACRRPPPTSKAQLGA